ncbi:MAG: type 1 glutamine amidotransferase domain-containing protein [Proteobacteria bacterium]|nr:type 1 glutamine amidotransferase domain-containing protein [Pseudomonadota bacterium]
MAHVLMPLPSLDFDPTEAAVSWRVLSRLGHRVSFATPDGQPAAADPIMLSGRGLDPWSRVPGFGRLEGFGLILRANAEARAAYAQMAQAAPFVAPLSWQQAHAQAQAQSHAQSPTFDGILLPGGHRARGMRAYLQSELLQALVAGFFAADRPVAAICHGVLVAARSRDAAGRSVLYGRRTTALTWRQERTADRLARIGRFWDPHYYRTYLEAPGQPPGYMSVQQEVTRALQRPEHFIDVPADAPHHLRKTLGLARDTVDDERPAWVVCDGCYVSARWPGDAHTFAKTFARLLSR